MRMHKFRYFFYRYVLISVVFLLIFLPNIVACRAADQSMTIYHLLNFGGLYLSQALDIVGLIKFLVPNLFIIYMFSDIMRSECIINYAYVFTRTVKKQKWLFQESAKLFFYVAVMYLWLFIFAFILGKIAGFSNIEPGSFVRLILPLYFLNVLSMFEFTFLQNVLSMRNGSTLAFMLIVFLYAVPLIAVSLLHQNFDSNAVLYFILPVNQMYLWHADRISLNGAEEFLSGSIRGFSLFYSLLALPVNIVVNYQIYRWFFIRKDMIELVKE